MNEKKLRLGLIGKDVSNSKSGNIHTFILKEFGYACEYEKFSVCAEDFESTMQVLLGDFHGFNVTIPYKREVFSFLDEVENDALSCGAVNTVVNQTRTGYNTDGDGFLLMLSSFGFCVQGKKVLVLGVGGAGRSVALALKKQGAEVFAYRRNAHELKEACEQLGVQAVENPECGGFDIIINCSGIGMHDTVGVSPVSERAFEGAEAAIDLIYRPEKSKFLQVAERLGLKILNGASMLFYQAYFADCLFLNKKPCEEQAKELYEKYLKQTQNEVKL